MANKKNKDAVAAFEDALQADRRERNIKLAQEMLGTNPQKLAQEMLGSKNRLTSTTRTTPTPTTLASRAGITKRSASLPRNHPGAPRNPRQSSGLSRSAGLDENVRPSGASPSSGPVSDAKSNGYSRQEDANGEPELNIRGAARGPFIVQASNFASGTTAADIESVMQSVGGAMNYCRLVASTPTVIAEMSFVSQDGAERVIEMFNNKKADGQLLYVYYARQGKGQQQPLPSPPQPPAEEPVPSIVDTAGDTTMEVDQHAESREIEDKQREERRGREESGDNRYLRTGEDYRRGGRFTGSEYEDGRYTFQRDRRYGGGRGGGGGGRYRDQGRMFSDSMRRRGSQSYRP
ncbi:hypothetical protein M433DRAFT_316719 [Acidomyces richmondensis BFW]|nr:MAG: hypothetical protein FE78DRAFT_354880 [Acidomyces sp. 'richmondensis']KYG44176.1 hypothetical protein M433DRAFT_316719 [Acidomyces richmondensis BFW]